MTAIAETIRDSTTVTAPTAIPISLVHVEGIASAVSIAGPINNRYRSIGAGKEMHAWNIRDERQS